MSLEYTLELSETHAPEMVAQSLGKAPSYRSTMEGVVAKGMYIDIGEPRPLEIATIEDEFEFRPATHVVFRLDKVTDPIVMRIRLIQGCMAVLRESRGDSVLLFNGEFIVLRRHDGLLKLNKSQDFWTKEVLQIVTEPYKFASFESI